MSTFSTMPATSMAADPLATSVAPTTPPIRACDELDGSPRYQVTRFQVIAPISPAKTMLSVIALGSTTPLAIVVATASERNAPTTLRRAERPTATRGGSARVAIDVAIALAVSWNPLVKSNASAVPTTITSRKSLPMPPSCQCARAPDVARGTGRDPDLHQIPTSWRSRGPFAAPGYAGGREDDRRQAPPQASTRA